MVAISSDQTSELRKLAASQGYTFPLLSDPNAQTIRTYGVLHERGGEDGHDIARPAEFLVDADGLVRWSNITGSIVSRLRPETVLSVLDQLQAKSH